MKFHPVEGLSFHCNFTINSNAVQKQAACKWTIKCFAFIFGAEMTALQRTMGLEAQKTVGMLTETGKAIWILSSGFGL